VLRERLQTLCHSSYCADERRPCSVVSMQLEHTSTRPRILLVTPQPFYEDRGTPIAVQYVARALSEIGAQVDLLAYPIGQEVAIRNVRIRRCANPLGFRRVPIGFSWRKVVLDASLWSSFVKRLSLRRYDMVHAVEEAAYIAAAICPRLGQPFIYDMASAIPVELQRKLILNAPRVQGVLNSVQKWVLNRAAHVICSPGLGGYVHREAPEAAVSEWRFPAQVRSVASEETESLRLQLAIASDRRVVLYSGSFAGYQGIDLLFDAFVTARHSHPELMLVCVGATEQEMATWSKRIPAELADHVRIVRRQPRDRIATYIGLADFLALPRGNTENVPLKLFDYMASGKPIIAMRSAAFEPLLDRSRAFICEPTAQSLAQALVRACRSPDEAAAVGRESARYARRQFGWSRFVEFVRSTYAHSILDGRQPTRLTEPG
jgi:glycosyltransferase involved in cell wall biosynthesis